MAVGSQIPIGSHSRIEGFDKCARHIENLIDSSELLHKRYIASIPLSILAFEETAKLQFIQEHLKSGKDIEIDEWKNLTHSNKTHNLKSTRIYDKSIQSMNEIPEEEYLIHAYINKNLGLVSDPLTHEEAKKPKENVLRVLRSYNKIKQDCLYLDWRHSQRFSIYTSVNKVQKKALSTVFLTMTKLSLSAIIRENKWIEIPPVGTKEFEEYMKDPIVCRERELVKSTKEPSFIQMVEIVHKIIDQHYQEIKS